jgi:Na+-driven multidrug efflux pump
VYPHPQAHNATQAAFSVDAEVEALVQHLLLYVAIMQPLNALVFVGDGIGQVYRKYVSMST